MIEESGYKQLVARWDAFLSKIDGRFEESLHNAKEALLENLDESNYDVVSFMQSWSGIKAQILNLSRKIEETFETKVLPEMLEYKKEYELVDERQKGIKLGESFYTRMDEFQIILEGEIAQKFYNHAIMFLNEQFKCSQCGAPLEIKRDIFRSHYVSCDFCNTVNTFKPNDKIAQIREFAIDNMVRLHCFDKWKKMEQAKTALSVLNPPGRNEAPTKYKQAFEERIKAEKTYWTCFLKKRMDYLPEYEESFEHDLAVKMRFTYDEYEQILGYKY